MILIFDLDGVLTETKELHETAFLKALKENGIEMSREEHKKLCGLPTLTKLKIIGVQDPEKINRRKQEITETLPVKIPKHIPHLLWALKSEGHRIWMASNASRKFCQRVMENIGDVFTGMVCSEDYKPKPSPEMYLSIMGKEKAVIFEDSIHGLGGAYLSGALVCPIDDPYQLTYEKVRRFISCST
jgi:beta-phosphoglucomutase-like phosphatase (HAD superfamily)